MEEELRGQVSPECPDLLARVDLLVDDGEALTVLDLKTARSRWSQQQAEDSGEQLLLYGELAKDLIPGKPLRLHGRRHRICANTAQLRRGTARPNHSPEPGFSIWVEPETAPGMIRSLS